MWSLTDSYRAGTAVATVLAVLVSATTGHAAERMGGADAMRLAQAMPPRTQDPGFPARLDRLGVSKGDPDAPVVLREFGDYQCPACRSFYRKTVTRLLSEYVDTGKVRMVFFDLPLTNIHQHAMVAAQAARCAGRQDDYWGMHKQLYSKQPKWKKLDDPVPRFGDYAGELGLDGQALVECVRDEKTLDAVKQSATLAQKLQIPSTPTVLVGTDGLSGAQPYERIKEVIDRHLKEQNEAEKNSS